MGSTTPRVITEPLGGGPLARAALAGRAPEGWFAPLDGGGWRERLARVRETTAAGWLEALRPAFGDLEGAAGARLTRVAAAGGAVVTTGQQPGLFGGPVYTWTKALSALALADAIERQTGVPTAPVFWAATDDADFAEARDTYVVAPGAVERLALSAAPPEATPMYAAPLGDARDLYDALERCSGSVVHPEALRAARESYDAGETVGGAYVRLLRAVLEPLGIAVLDAGHAAFRAAAFPHLREALERAADLELAVHARSEEISDAGFDPQVAEVEGLSLVFAGMEGTKRRVRVADAAATAASAVVGDLGATVLLRPALERRLLPTAAYVAGPGELAYFAQVGAVADTLGWERPRPVPRWSATIVEPQVQRILDRHGLAIDDLRDPHAAESRLARAAVPAGQMGAVTALREAADRARADLNARDASGPALLPPAALDGFRRQIELRIERLERRLVAAAKRRETDTMRDLATARGSLFPLGQRQERVLNFLPMLARHGRPLLDAMLEQARAHAASMVATPSLPPATPAETTLL